MTTFRYFGEKRPLLWLTPIQPGSKYILLKVILKSENHSIIQVRRDLCKLSGPSSCSLWVDTEQIIRGTEQLCWVIFLVPSKKEIWQSLWLLLHYLTICRVKQTSSYDSSDFYYYYYFCPAIYVIYSHPFTVHLWEKSGFVFNIPIRWMKTAREFPFGSSGWAHPPTQIS